VGLAVIEFEHEDIPIAAIGAGMCLQVGKDLTRFCARCRLTCAIARRM